MLGSTLLPLVWKYTVSLSSDVVNELVKMDIEDIVHLMESADALQVKVEEIKEMIRKKIKDIAPYIPKIASPPATAENQPMTIDEAWEKSEEPIASMALPSLRKGTGVFQIGSLSRFQNGTGFFDVSRIR